ncbi:MAG TPA: (2Fe-2S)-binding protein [Pseudonocardia sp.]|nr:(2Fe-2S)-binding protein [Pseudonocardia sp.]
MIGAPTSAPAREGAPALGDTVAMVDSASEWLTLRLGMPAGADGWIALTEIDPDFMRAWEALAAEYQRAEYGRTDPVTAAAYALSWYAGVPGEVGGACLQTARRVPRLQPESLAVHRHPTEHHVDGVALLDERFWCLPDDPAAGDPAATVVTDEAALAAVLRAEVRTHADRFLAWYRPGARLPRRGLLGAFVDGLDCGVWTGGGYRGEEPASVLATAATVLPGRTPQFTEASTMYLLTDDRGREHLTRQRVACCFYYRLDEAREACFTCPRTDLAQRRRRAATWDDGEH